MDTLARAVSRLLLLALAGAGAARPQTIAITGGTVFPVTGPRIPNGTVVITDGKVAAVGAGIPIPAGAERVDATGKWVTPGLFVAATSIGLSEAGGPQFSGGYNDTRANGSDGIAASFRAWEGFNPANTFLRKNVQAGVTTIGLTASSGYLGGQAAVLHLAGATVSEMTVRGGAAMVASWSPGAAGAQSRGEFLAKLREVLADAKAYGARRAQYEAGGTRSFAAPRRELEALQPVVAGTMPLIVAASRVSDLRAALALAKEFGLRLVLAEADEAWAIAPEIAAAGVPVLAGAMNSIPRSFDALGARQENPALLRKAGVRLVLVNTGPADADNYNIQNIRQEAGNAVAYGLPWDEALRAITLAPAEVMGVADRVGSLAPGRDADVVVWSGDPFEFESVAERVYVRGRLQAGASRQDALMSRYRTASPGWFGRP